MIGSQQVPKRVDFNKDKKKSEETQPEEEVPTVD